MEYMYTCCNVEIVFRFLKSKQQNCDHILSFLIEFYKELLKVSINVKTN